jgi:hypothetical protein
LKTGKPALRQAQNFEGFIFFLFYYTNINIEVYQKLKLQTEGTCVREPQACGTKP